MNFHNLLAGENVTNTELEEKVSKIIGLMLIGSLLVNVVTIPIAIGRSENREANKK